VYRKRQTTISHSLLTQLKSSGFIYGKNFGLKNKKKKKKKKTIFTMKQQPSLILFDNIKNWGKSIWSKVFSIFKFSKVFL